MSQVVLTVPGSFKHKVSSTLNGAAEFASKVMSVNAISHCSGGLTFFIFKITVSMFDLQHMFDGTETSCWNSDGGSPQFVIFDFGKPVCIKTIHIMFQGGFVGEEG
jgi:hypothetical protein